MNRQKLKNKNIKSKWIILFPFLHFETGTTIIGHVSFRIDK